MSAKETAAAFALIVGIVFGVWTTFIIGKWFGPETPDWTLIPVVISAIAAGFGSGTAVWFLARPRLTRLFTALTNGVRDDVAR